MRITAVAVLAALIACKFYVALAEEPGFSVAKLPVAAIYAILFGSPQLLWLLKARRVLSPGQAIVAVAVTITFILTAIYFGSVPGSRPPSWGGEGHFEVPAAFVVEWVIGLVGLGLFRLARPN